MDRLSVAILVPVLGRPHRVAPLLASIAAATPQPYRALFICDRHDREEQRAVDAAGGERVTFEGGWARKINRGCALTDDPLVLLAADDIRPRPGWLGAACEAIDGGAEVVGLNDLRPRMGEHATHFLLTRQAAELPTIDGGRGPVHEGYAHNFPDRELIETAKRRGHYAYARRAVVEHLHHLDGKAERDATYEKGDATFRLDSRRFRGRSHLWT